MKNLVVSPVLPSCRVAASTSFSSSLTAYSSVVLVSSTSSTIKMFLPTRLDICRELRSSHCVRVTLVPGSSSGSSCPIFSYRDRPIAWIGIFGEPGRLRKDLEGWINTYRTRPRQSTLGGSECTRTVRCVRGHNHLRRWRSSNSG